MRITHTLRAVALALAVTATLSTRAADAQGAHATGPRLIAPIPTLSPWSGVFRLQLKGERGDLMVFRLIVERDGDRMSGILITDANGITPVDLTLDDHTVRGSAQTSEGRGWLVLHETSGGLEGTFTVGRMVYTVVGARTA